MGRRLGKEPFNFLQKKICSGLPLVVPAVKTLCFQGRELEFDPWSGLKISCASQRGQKNLKSMFKDFSIYLESRKVLEGDLDGDHLHTV